MNENSMKKDFDDYELDNEYDLSKLPILPKGRFAPLKRQSANLVILEPEIAKAFPTDESVNQTLRLVMQMLKIPTIEKLVS